MKRNVRIFFLLLVSTWFVSCQRKPEQINDSKTKGNSIDFSSGYSQVNGIKLYYEVYGKGQPLVLLHGGGSTIQSSFGRVIPALAKTHQVIAVELQNHGRSDTRKVAETFGQDAEDVFALMKNLNIPKANFLGFSNGGHTLFELALHHPEIINQLIIASSPYKKSGFIAGFFESMPKATLASMPHDLKTEFLKVNPDSIRLQTMFEHDRDRMVNFKGWTDEQIKSITIPTLLINGDMDVLTPEHAVEMHRMLSRSQLTILPGGHGKYMGEITTLGKDGQFADYLTPLVNEFLNTK
ncbi:MAG TPA: alpha/beta hydrolase [Cyclobacteriaceae bacterium]|nr:alpha/beta hydrolase [Cyclobacteriaceae bacterium]